MTPATALERLTRRTVRVGVTGLARAGKTAFLTSIAANLLALGAGHPVLPALAARLRGRPLSVSIAPVGASSIPRFDHAAHLAALAADPPGWPARTDAASLLALDLTLPRAGFGQSLPPQRIRLELLDYPGEWLLDLPLLQTSFDDWSAATLRRLETRAEAASFNAFVAALPAGCAADETLAFQGHRLYRDSLVALREAGLALLQPGRFLMPAPGPEPAWTPFFPHTGRGPLHDLLARRYQAYGQAVIRDLSDPLFGRIDRMLVLVDLLTALASGPEAFDDTHRAIAAAAAALRWTGSWRELAASLARFRLPPPTIGRVVFAATKADHVGERQRANLASLLRHAAQSKQQVTSIYQAIASVRCTEDAALTFDDLAAPPERPRTITVSAVCGLLMDGSGRQKSYPGEVPSDLPGPEFWGQFHGTPEYQPKAIRLGAGVPNLGLDTLLVAMLDDVL